MNWSDGTLVRVVVKGETTAPTVVSIKRGTTPNPVPPGTPLIDYVVTFSDAVTAPGAGHFTISETVSAQGARGTISSIACSGPTCTVWVSPVLAGQLRLDLSSTTGITDLWGNDLVNTRTGDETYTLTG